VHDQHAVQNLIERLSDLEDVAEVRIRAGASFSPEALRQAFEMLTADTPLAGSRLVVEGLVEERGCPTCGSTWAVSSDDVAGHLVLCPSCGAPSPIGPGASAIEVVEVARA